ncbi:MLO-like protein 3 [Pyrus x bretschneideri]|uniref:MLO-like protein 3 n=1 Tax=Pyrus x bretschneideri TaxID=225117 RepID=UPI00202E9320|nr:MLO-like protein 3 [Pyrus x bretschneideri]
MAGDSKGASLEYTPTWALATVCFFFIFTSLVIEHSIHLLVNFLKRRRKTALTDAVEKLKSELMLMGFVSLLLAVTQDSISKICIPAKLGNIMLPCRRKETTEKTDDVEKFVIVNKILTSTGSNSLHDEILRQISVHRRLAEEGDATAADSCSEGKVHFMTTDALRQLHILIFVLAVMHIVYSVLTMALGRAKMRRWEAWEQETRTVEYQVENDPNRFRFTRQTTFGRRHMNSSSETSFHLWMRCFFRQFYNSVAKVDYITIRHGFIAAHLPSRQSFDFQKYIQRSLEEDFKIMVAISPLMWFVVAIFMLVDVYGWHVYLWLSYVPLLAVLVLGAKLEYVVAKMALQIKEQNSVIVGTPLVRVNDDFFWFRKPRFVLLLLHYTLFLNAFEFAFFIWVTIQFGFKSCYHELTVSIVTRISLAVTTQVLCSYITLPLYALVTQMGSQFRGKIMEHNMADILKQWHAEVRNRRRKQHQLLQSARTSFSADWSSVRNSFSEMPSYIRKVSKPDEPAESSVQLSNRGNVQDEIVELDGSSRVYGRNGDNGT